MVLNQRNSKKRRKNPKKKRFTKRRVIRGGGEINPTISLSSTTKGGSSFTQNKAQYCSPYASNNSSFSCYDHNTLKQIASKLNSSRRLSKENEINVNQSSFELWNNLNKEFSSECTTERCWAKKTGLNETMYFRPLMPSEWKSDMNTWLSNFEIMDVLKQYEHKHSDFLFIGPTTIDFATKIREDRCIQQSMCSFNVKELIQQKKYKIGIVINLDRHDQTGSHWVALFINLLIGGVYYYDSYARPPPGEIVDFMRKVAVQGTSVETSLSPTGTPFVTEYNKVRHQFKNSECGVYCMYFITQMLENVNFETFTNNGLHDDAVNKFRTYYFDPVGPV